MTDLPQLQTNLVDAAARRRRRRRVRRVTARVAVAATLLVAVPAAGTRDRGARSRGDGADPDPDRHGRPAEDGRRRVRRRSADPRPRATRRRGSRRETRRASSAARQAHPRLPRQARRRAVPGRPRHLAADGVQPGARVHLRREALLVRAAGICSPWPCRTPSRRSASPTPGFKPFTLEAADALAVTFGAGSGRLESTAPDGTPRADHIYRGDAATNWGRFWDVERPADRLDDLPGARRIVSDPEVDAWLVPRRDAVCLLVRAGEDQNSGCRRNLGDTRFPIVVSVEHRIVAAFPDRLRPLSVEPPPATAIRSNALLIRDGDVRRQLHLPRQCGPARGAPAGPEELRPERRPDVAAGPHAGIGRTAATSGARDAHPVRDHPRRWSRRPAAPVRPRRSGGRAHRRAGRARAAAASCRWRAWTMAPGRAAAWAPVFTPTGARARAHVQELFIGLDARAALPGMLAAVERFAPDLIVRETCEFASSVAAERFGVPPSQVGIHLDTTIDTGEALLAIADPALRRLGLERRRRLLHAPGPHPGPAFAERRLAAPAPLPHRRRRRASATSSTSPSAPRRRTRRTSRGCTATRSRRCRRRRAGHARRATPPNSARCRRSARRALGRPARGAGARDGGRRPRRVRLDADGARRRRPARVHPAVRRRPRQRPPRRRRRGRAARRRRPRRHRRAPRHRGRAPDRGRDRRAGAGQRLGSASAARTRG